MPLIPWRRLVCGTIAVVALICVGVYVLKKLNGGAPLTRGRYLELLESRPVGRNVQLFLVRVAGKVVLLASGGGSVTQVAELAEEELPELSTASPPEGLEAFRNLFRKLAGARN
jgi:flagellar biogenesis protein FliO